MTEVIVFIAETPSHPAASAVRAGKLMSVMLGVILAHTGFVVLALIQPQTSCAHATLQPAILHHHYARVYPAFSSARMHLLS